MGFFHISVNGPVNALRQCIIRSKDCNNLLCQDSGVSKTFNLISTSENILNNFDIVVLRQVK